MSFKSQWQNNLGDSIWIHSLVKARAGNTPSNVPFSLTMNAGNICSAYEKVEFGNGSIWMQGWQGRGRQKRVSELSVGAFYLRYPRHAWVVLGGMGVSLWPPSVVADVAPPVADTAATRKRLSRRRYYVNRRPRQRWGRQWRKGVRRKWITARPERCAGATRRWKSSEFRSDATAPSILTTVGGACPSRVTGSSSSSAEPEVGGGSRVVCDLWVLT